jgi:hypothetical protein
MAFLILADDSILHPKNLTTVISYYIMPFAIAQYKTSFSEHVENGVIIFLLE